MSDVAQRIAEMMLRTEAIQVYKDKPFVFVSGRISPVYIDCRKILSFPEEREYIVTELAEKAETAIGLANIDIVAGGETAGIPYASFVSHLIKKPMIYIRKQPKGYGGSKQIEGILEAGKRVLLVEDLITDGLSKLRFNIGIRAAGAKMTHCLCVFDYASDRLNQHEGETTWRKMTSACTCSLTGTMCSTRVSARATSLKTPASRSSIFSKTPRIGAARWALCDLNPLSTASGFVFLVSS